MTAFIRAENLSLDVPVQSQRDRDQTGWFHTLFTAATAHQTRQFRRLLDGVTFSLEEGDRLALIGPNGAGKSTLLRVLTGAYAPTEGRLKVKGKRQAMLNVKLGFNKHATLMENIYLRGTAMGIPGGRLRELARPVLEFAGLEHKAQDRLYTLSSGQRMRLGFAIATAVRQDIILMDEWLGAGDASFLERARQRMDDRVSGSKIVVLASHNRALVTRVCNKGLVMRDGRIDFFGDADEALSTYQAEVKARRRARRAEQDALIARIDGPVPARGGKAVKKGGKAVKKGGKAVKKSGKAVKKSGKAVKKSGKAVKKSGKAVKKSGKTARGSQASGKPPASNADEQE